MSGYLIIFTWILCGVLLAAILSYGSDSKKEKYHKVVESFFHVFLFVLLASVQVLGLFFEKLH